MIYFVDKDRFSDLKSFCTMQTIYSCRIMCLAYSYGLDFDFVQFWLQYNESGNVTSAISKSNGDITIQTSKNSDISELREFLEFIGYTSLLCETQFEFGSKAKQGIIMELITPIRIYTNFGTVLNPDLNLVYDLLEKCRNKDFKVPEYEDFMLDMSHKIRHNMAMCTAVVNKNNLISVAMTVAQSRNTAIIGAVAVDPKFRRQGYGGQAVLSLSQILENRKIFVMCDKIENERFYKSLGFEDSGSFTVINKRKEEVK